MIFKKHGAKLFDLFPCTNVIWREKPITKKNQWERRNFPWTVSVSVTVLFAPRMSSQCLLHQWHLMVKGFCTWHKMGKEPGENTLKQVRVLQKKNKNQFSGYCGATLQKKKNLYMQWINVLLKHRQHGPALMTLLIIHKAGWQLKIWIQASKHIQEHPLITNRPLRGWIRTHIVNLANP